MPPKRRAPRRGPARRRYGAKRRVFRKRKSRFNRQSVLTYNPRGRGVLVPDRYLTTMKVSGFGHYAAVDGKVDFTILGNGLLDPFETKGSVNVTGLAQMAALYQRYIVHGSRIRLDATSETGATARLVVVAPVYGTPVTTVTSILDNAYVKSKMLASTGGMDRVSLTNYMSTRKLAGLKDLKDEENQWGTGSTNPGFAWHWNVRVDNNTGAGTESTAVRFTLTYYVEWFDRLELNQA